ncbi:hypothetical protein M427DRAFT_464247 [Gonapodya prolifera JEL478]|uniref:G-protein coupled receptors family 1 profile domain-containing protein n=1 Tax=Gonapodya prolifera (strain JEL478) TaxID=1344416 RepID=A0A139A1Z4_GONPJ|nr:hypothetical protein M427DRAFT_464247 [Gonapodya prolifera JEL478]|eukprot:KXS10709.1 hypothetical protein M427DRAFT_464247 [Gonapodya prolifera JEL478]
MLDRRSRAIFHSGPVSFSVLSDICVLCFYAVAAGLRVSHIRHTVHKLLAVLFVFNIVALCCWLGETLSYPETPRCNISIFGEVGGFGGEYYSSLAILIVLYRSLVLNHPPFSAFGEGCAIAIPFGAFLAGGLIVILSQAHAPDGTTCFAAAASTATILAMIIGLGFAFVASVILVAGILFFRMRRGANETPESLRVSGSGIMAVSSRSKDDANALSVRLVLYPVLMLLTGGLAVITASLAITSAAIVGEALLALSGIFNAIIFFGWDPTARKLAFGMLEIINSATGTGHPLPRPSSITTVNADGKLQHKRLSSFSGITALSIAESRAELINSRSQSTEPAPIALYVGKIIKPFLRWMTRP